MLAEVLGGKVYPHTHKEIGWTEVKLTEEGKKEKTFSGLQEKLTVFQYHGDSFDLPADTTLLASGHGCMNQAFVYKSGYLDFSFIQNLQKILLSKWLKRTEKKLNLVPLYKCHLNFLGNIDY